MMRRLMALGILVSAAGALSTWPARADITLVTGDGGGPGGGVSSIAIETTSNPNDSVAFLATYATPAPIDLTVTVDGPGTYFIGRTDAMFSNATSDLFSAMNAELVNAPAGSILDEIGYSILLFSNGGTFSPSGANPTDVMLMGPPGLAAGDSTNIYVVVVVSAAGPQTFGVDFTPTAVVPEPSALALGLVGAAAGLGYRAARTRRHRRRASVTS